MYAGKCMYEDFKSQPQELPTFYTSFFLLRYPPHFESGSLFIWSLPLQLSWPASSPQAHTLSLSSVLG